MLYFMYKYHNKIKGKIKGKIKDKIKGPHMNRQKKTWQNQTKPFRVRKKQGKPIITIYK